MTSSAHVRQRITEISELFRRFMANGDKIGGFEDEDVIKKALTADAVQIKRLIEECKGDIVVLKQRCGNGVSDEEINRLEREVDELGTSLRQGLPQVIERLRESRTSGGYDQPQQGMEEHLLDQEMIDGQTEQLEELATMARSIIAQMTNLKATFDQTLSEIVNQRHKIVQIESYTEDARGNMQTGNDQLEKAAVHQKGTTKCLCWIFIILGVIIAGIAVFLCVKYA